MVELFRGVFESLLPHLDERQRRLAAGAVARALGHGGMVAAARASGLSQATVSDGVWELEAGPDPLGRIRRPGAGRKSAEVVDPGLVPALLGLVEPTRRGDPMGPLSWTTLSTRDLAGELTAAGHRIGASVVGKLLRANGFVLRGNAKVLEGSADPDRDAQFRHINDTATAFLTAGDPVISIDAKKKEMVGNFANPGRTWHPAGAPVEVLDHSFLIPELGVAIPFGIYDITANTGWVNVGTDHGTAAFAVESIRRWWHDQGSRRYPTATRLLITADAGGSNAANSRLFKTELQALAVQTGLEISVCHFPAGTSKWNKIEHRLFSAITRNWRGQPLTSLQVVVDTIAATTTTTGLQVHAELDTGSYPTGREIPDAQFKALPIDHNPWRGDLNYTLHPEPPAPTPPPRPALPDPDWLRQPLITGLTNDHFDALVRYLTPPAPPAGTPGRRPGTGGFTTRHQLLAAALQIRHRLPQTAIATLLGVAHTTIAHGVPATIRALAGLGFAFTPAEQPLRTPDRLTAALGH
ncbi:ISAzo13 family transposase [Catenulispora pinisilvae]|uniref:ISAzo13 family transposase n=1 Tax=Catenulispora pinisilvae TaxID=2705253 RepID=UPI003F6A2BC1